VPPRDPADQAVLADLAQLDPDGLSPREALTVLFSLKERLRKDR